MHDAPEWYQERARSQRNVESLAALFVTTAVTIPCWVWAFCGWNRELILPALLGTVCMTVFAGLCLHTTGSEAASVVPSHRVRQALKILRYL